MLIYCTFVCLCSMNFNNLFPFHVCLLSCTQRVIQRSAVYSVFHEMFVDGVLIQKL